MKNTAILFTLFLVGCGSSTTVNPDYNEYEPGEGGSAGETYVKTGGTDPVSTGGNDPVSTGGNDPVSTGGTGNVTETGGAGNGTGGSDDPYAIFQIPDMCWLEPSVNLLDECADFSNYWHSLLCANQSNYPEIVFGEPMYFAVDGYNNEFLRCIKRPGGSFCCTNVDDFI